MASETGRGVCTLTLPDKEPFDNLYGYLASRRKSPADMTRPRNHNFGVGGASS